MIRFLAILKLLCLAPLLSHATEGEVRIALGDDYPPYVDRDLPRGGLHVAIMEEALSRMELGEPVYIWGSWRRALEVTRKGIADMTFPWNYTRDRAGDFLSTVPLVTLHDYSFSRAGTSHQTPEEMEGKTACLPDGYAPLGFFGKMLTERRVFLQRPRSMMLCFKMLNGGRVDFVVSAENEARKAIADAKIDSATVAMSSVPIHTAKLGVLVSRKISNPQKFVDQLDDILSVMMADGTWKRLSAAYQM